MLFRIPKFERWRVTASCFFGFFYLFFFFFQFIANQILLTVFLSFPAGTLILLIKVLSLYTTDYNSFLVPSEPSAESIPLFLCPLLLCLRLFLGVKDVFLGWNFLNRENVYC